MIIFAHRGYSSKYPENTMTAFKEAIKWGARAIETDVQLTKDNKMVLIHDENTKRTSGVDKLVSDMTLEEIKKLDFSYRDKFKESDTSKTEEILELKDLLILCKENNILLNLELKNSIIDYKNIEKMVLEEVKKYGDYENVIYSTFNHDSVKRLKDLDKNIKAAPLFEEAVPDFVSYAKNLGAHGIHPGLLKLDENYKNLVRYVKSKGLYVNIYTVNDKEIAKELKDLGVDGIFTDYPEDMIAALSK